MVQAARSGVRNISEGSGAAATSKKTEIRLTNVARASLSDELLKDYAGFAFWGCSAYPDCRRILDIMDSDMSDLSVKSDPPDVIDNSS